MTALTTLKDRFTEVSDRIAAAAERSGRPASEVLLVAVTKYAEPDEIRTLMRLGHQDFGESRVQQLIQRSAMAEEYIERLRTAPHAAKEHDEDTGNVPESVRWHMIGRLQRNKVKKAVEHARLIHSVDSMRLAEEVQSVALRRDDPVDVLLQVNCSGEASKQGIATPAALHVGDQIDTMVNVRLRGLMTMAPLTEDADQIRITFERCRECFDDMRKRDIGGSEFNILSMGMSSDYELAIEYGSNLVRVGTAIFGERLTADDED